MASFGYMVYLVRAGKPFNTPQMYRLNAVGDAEDDLLTRIYDLVHALGPGYHSQPSSSEGYRVKERDLSGRALWIKINRGPEGVPGETYDRDNDLSTETTERIALLSGLRAMFVLPADAYFGLLFVEKIGVRNLKELLVEVAVKPAATLTQSLVRVEAFAEISDWQRAIEPLHAVRISESLVVRTSGDDASTAEDTVIKVMAEGAAVRRATSRVKDIFFSRIARRDERLEVLARSSELGERRRAAEADGVTFQDEAEYQAEAKRLRDLNQADIYEPELGQVLSDVAPVDRDAAEHKKFSVELGDTKPRRTIAIEGNAIPTFTYELGARLTDGGLRQTWVAHAETILRNRGVTLPVGWDLSRKTTEGKP